MSQQFPEKLQEMETELRVLREKLADADKLVRVRIDELDKRNQALVSSMEGTKDFVDKRARLMGIGSVFGLPIALIILFWVIYSTGKPVAEEAAKEAAKAIDWSEHVEAAANVEVRKLVTPEALARVIDNESIKSAATDVLDSEAFQRTFQELIEANAALFQPSHEELAQFAKATLDNLRPDIEKAIAAQVSEAVAGYKIDERHLSLLIKARIEEKNGFLEAEVTKHVEAAVAQRVEVIRNQVSTEVAKRTKDLDPKTFVSSQLLKELVQKYVSESLLQNQQFLAQVRTAIVSTLDERILDSNEFRMIIDKQFEAERARLHAFLTAAQKVQARTKDELIASLVTALAPFNNEVLRQERSKVVYYPFDDTLAIEVTIGWALDNDQEPPFDIRTIRLVGVGPATKERQKLIDQYFGAPVASDIYLSLSEDGDESTFEPRGIVFRANGEKRQFATYEAASRGAAEIVVKFLESCFGISYPTAIRVRGR